MNFLHIFIVIFLLVIFLCGGGVILYLFIKTYKSKTSKNAPIIINPAPQYSNNRVLGSLISIETGRKNRKLIKMVPGDVDVDKDSEDEVKFISDKVVTLPKGFSSDRDIILTLPPRVEDLNKNFIKLGEKVEEKNVDNHIIEVMRESKDRKNLLRKISAGGELSRDEIRRLKGLIDDLSKDKKSDKGDYKNL